MAEFIARNGLIAQNNSVVTGSLTVTNGISSSLYNGYTPSNQDGTILYHSVKWFTPTSTISTSGTTATSIGTQFTSTMVGSKLTISGETRIITAYISTTQVTVASAYSINYSGISAANWGVYSIAQQIATDGVIRFYSIIGGNRYSAYLDQYMGFYNEAVTVTNVCQFNSNGGLFSGNKPIRWNNSINNLSGTIDLGLRRNAAGILEIYDGITATGLEANRRDLLVRNTLSSKVLIGTTVDNNSLLNVQGTVTASGSLARGSYIAPTLVAAANNDVLVGLDIAPTFTNGAFTGVKNYLFRYGSFFIDNTGAINSPLIASSGQLQLSAGGSNSNLSFYTNSTANIGARMFGLTRNWIFQDGGTFTDNGYRLDVSGSARITDGLTVTGSLTVTNGISSSLYNGYTPANEDGTILYSPTSAFIPTSTVSSNGTTVTSIGTQFLLSQVKAKLKINGESRIITAYISTTQVTVDSAYSTNYSGATNWGVYFKGFEIPSNGYPTFYLANQSGGAPPGTLFLYNNAGFPTTQYGFQTNNTLSNGQFHVHKDFTIRWSNSTSYEAFSSTTIDLGIRRNSAGVLEIHNGINTSGLEANRRDLLVRNTFSSKVLIGTTVDNSSLLNVQGTVTASGSLARSSYIAPNLVAAVNYDVLVGLDIAPTFTNGAFTGVANYGIRHTGDLVPSSANGYTLGNTSLPYAAIYTRIIRDLSQISYRCDNQGWFNNANTQVVKLFSTGNLVLQNGGTFTDNGARLQVGGVTTASASLARGVSITETLVASASNDVLVGLDIDPTYTSGSFTGLQKVGLRVEGINIGRGAGSVSSNIMIGNTNTTNTGNNNIFVGTGTAVSNTTGYLNTFIGNNNGVSNTTGYSNVFVGTNNGASNTTGASNVFIGPSTGYNNTTGYGNIFMGQSAGVGNTSSSENLILGHAAGQNNSSGGSNVVLGAWAGDYIADKSTSLTSMSNSTMIGYQTTPLANSQTNQIVIGYNSTGLGSNTTVLGNSSTATTAIYGNLLLGTTSDAGYKLNVTGTTRLNGLQTFQGTVASDTAPLGSELLTTGTSDSSWTGTSFATGYTHVIGSVTTLTSTLAASINIFYQITYTITGRTAGSITIAFGGSSNAGITATGAVGPQASTTGTLVVTPTTDFNGTLVLSIKTIGNSSATTTFTNSSGTVVNEIRANTSPFNTFIGVNSGRKNTTGLYNIGIGQNAIASNTTGNNNIGFGPSSMLSNTTGYFNTAIGTNSLYSNTTGVQNTAIGINPLFNNTNGNNNVAIGVDAGRLLADKTTAATSLSTCILIGNTTSPLANGQTNQIVIGHNSNGLGSNTTVLGNSSTITTAIYGDLLLGTTTDSGTEKLQVVGNAKIQGQTILSGSQNTASGSILKVIGSGSQQPIFTVLGSQGELFSVTDSLSGSLFSVNDISGLPILEVFSDNTTLIGNYQAPALVTTTKNVLSNSGSFTVYSIPTASYDGAFFDYTARSGSNARAGQIMAIWSGSAVNYTSTTTTDFGSTVGLSLGVFISGSNMVLTGSAATTAWTVKTIIRTI